MSWRGPTVLPPSSSTLARAPSMSSTRGDDRSPEELNALYAATDVTRLSNLAPSAEGAPWCSKIRRRRPVGCLLRSGVVGRGENGRCSSRLDAERLWSACDPVAQHGGGGLHGNRGLLPLEHESQTPCLSLPSPRRTPARRVESGSGPWSCCIRDVPGS